MEVRKSRIKSVFDRRWAEWIILFVFILLTAGALLASFLDSALAQPRYLPVLNVALSIGTSGIVAFIFYYAVNERLERRRRHIVREGALRSYLEAKYNIAVAIIHASQKGGRSDLHADGETIDSALTISGFKAMFEGGRQADEGFYAFQNQMGNETLEYSEIVFNLKMASRAVERFIDSNHVDDRQAYDFFVRLGTLIERIERHGAGYDESKLLCRFIWEIFAGFNSIEGEVGYDPIERALRA